MLNMSFSSELLHTISQALTIPVVVILLLLIVYTVCLTGAVIVEYFCERRHFKASAPALVRALDHAAESDVEQVIRESSVLKTQQSALLDIWENRDLDPEALWSFAKETLASLNRRNQAAVIRVETVSKVAPMIGLLGTLIPLGPGIVALSTGDTATLAGALLIAFDTTVAGLVVSALCTVVARVRRSWYARYSSTMEAAANTLIEKIELAGVKRERNLEARQVIA